MRAPNIPEKSVYVRNWKPVFPPPMEWLRDRKREFVDISMLTHTRQLWNASMVKKWIKIIPLHETISQEEYNRRDMFTIVAEVKLDLEMNKKGNKKRNTLIRFIPTVPEEEFRLKEEWIYYFTIGNRIVKIGGTRNGLKSRTQSYLCGHHVQERGKSGDCSKTNGYIYNTFEFYLRIGCTIQMYARKLQKREMRIPLLHMELNVTMQTFHAFESFFLEDYKKTYKTYPFLSANCDPSYK